MSTTATVGTTATVIAGTACTGAADPLAGPIAAGQAATLRLSLVFVATGSCTVRVTFSSNDADENPFSFTVTAMSVSAAGEIGVIGFTGVLANNAMDDLEDRARELYELYAIPAPGRILWDSVLANFQPGHQSIWVDYHNAERAPLLFISGSDDHIMPPKIQQSNLKHYKSDALTEIVEFEGPHLMVSEGGLEPPRPLIGH